MGETRIEVFAGEHFVLLNGILFRDDLKAHVFVLRVELEGGNNNRQIFACQLVGGEFDESFAQADYR